MLAGSRAAMIAAATLAAACGASPPPAASTAPSTTSAAVDAPAPEPAQAPACLADHIELPPLDPGELRHDCRMQPAQACIDACDRGDGSACVEIGYALEGGDIDPALIRKAYAIACRRGNHSGCTNYGAWLFRRSEDPRDHACATRMFELTCGKGEHFGCGMLAMAYGEGRGVAADAARAMSLSRDACQRLGKFPCAVEGKLLEDRGDAAASRAAFVRSCETGYPEACAYLDQLGRTQPAP